MIDFNTLIDRSNSHTVKYDLLKHLFGREDLLPFWVADMEFQSAQCIQDSLRKIVDNGNYGYNIEPRELNKSIINWLETIQEWKIEDKWLTYIPGIFRGISYALHHFTKEGDKILVQTPIYHPFILIPKDNNRELVLNPLKRKENSPPFEKASNFYSIDFENLKEVTKDGDVKMMIFCNPHNPSGIRWSREQLIELAEICYERGIIVISDEIHSDLHLWGNKHIPFASVSEKAAQISITFGAPSKTFNIPGLASSFAIIPNPKLRDSFYKWLSLNEYNVPLIWASMATIAAYNEGNQWREECIKYIERNILFVNEFFINHLPSIKVVRPEASYLVWLDCRELSCSLPILSNPAKIKDFANLQNKYTFSTPQQKGLIDFFVNKGRIALSDGTIFGPGGDGFMRLNVACPQEMLSEGLNRLL